MGVGQGDRRSRSKDDKRVTIRDYGRGIPLGKASLRRVSEMNTGA